MKRISLKRIFIALLIVFVVGALALWLLIGYVFTHIEFVEKEDTENPTNAQLSELTWPEGSYKVFYLDSDEGLFSQKTDGTQKNLLYKYEKYGEGSQNVVEDFYLLDKSRG